MRNTQKKLKKYACFEIAGAAMVIIAGIAIIIIANKYSDSRGLTNAFGAVNFDKLNSDKNMSICYRILWLVWLSGFVMYTVGSHKADKFSKEHGRKEGFYCEKK